MADSVLNPMPVHFDWYVRVIWRIASLILKKTKLSPWKHKNRLLNAAGQMWRGRRTVNITFSSVGLTEFSASFEMPFFQYINGHYKNRNGVNGKRIAYLKSSRDADHFEHTHDKVILKRPTELKVMFTVLRPRHIRPTALKSRFLCFQGESFVFFTLRLAICQITLKY